MKVLCLALGAVFLMMLSSCIEGDEEIVIREDGSSHLKMRYQVPGMIFSAKDAKELVEILERELGHKDHLTLVKNRVDLVRGQRVIQIEIETEPGVEFEGGIGGEASENQKDAESKSNKMLHALVGDILTQRNGLSVEVVRRVNLQPLLDEYVGKNSTSMLGDSQFRYTVHLPKAALESNADEISADGKTLKWCYNLRETDQKPISMRLVAPIPLPWWVYGVGGGVIVVVFSGVYWGVKKNRKKIKKSVA